MSRQAIQDIIERALKDRAFAQLLKDNPDQALQDFDLTSEEAEVVRELRPETSDQFASFLDRRIVKTDGDAKIEGGEEGGGGDDVEDDWWVGSVTD